MRCVSLLKSGHICSCVHTDTEERPGRPASHFFMSHASKGPAVLSVGAVEHWLGVAKRWWARLARHPTLPHIAYIPGTCGHIRTKDEVSMSKPVARKGAHRWRQCRWYRMTMTHSWRTKHVLWLTNQMIEKCQQFVLGCSMVTVNRSFGHLFNNWNYCCYQWVLL